MRVHALSYCLRRFCLRRSRSFLFFVSLVFAGALPAAAANLISLQGNGGLLPNTAGQQITLLMSGGDTYTDSNLRFKINGGVGPAPHVTHIFGLTGAAFEPVSVLNGSIWQGGTGGVGNGEVGTYPTSTGLDMVAAFLTKGIKPQNTSGVYAVLTVSTIGVPAGSYTLDLAETDLINGLTSAYLPIFIPVDLADITLSIGVDASLSPATQISLGSALAQSTPVDLPSAVQVSNTGFLADALIVEAANITGPNADLFEVLGGFSPVELLAGADPLDLGLRFLGATAPGTYTAEVTLYFNDSPPLVYPLAVTVVPEPSSYLLALLGVAAVLTVRVRRTQRRAAVEHVAPRRSRNPGRMT